MNRRDFLTLLAEGAFGLSAAACSTPLDPRVVPDAGGPFRARGRVMRGASPAADVRVTNGLGVTRTDAEGFFELVSSSRPDFVFSTAAGCREVVRGSSQGQHRFATFPAARREVDLLFDVDPQQGLADSYQLGFLPDLHLYGPDNLNHFKEVVIPDLLSELVSATPDEGLLVFFGGDMISDTPGLLPAYCSVVGTLGREVFHMLGNHDRDLRTPTRMAKELFTQTFGPRYYSLDLGLVHCVVLDTIQFIDDGWTEGIDPPQAIWLAEDLASLEPGQSLVVFSHLPYYSLGAQSKELLAGLLSPFRVHYFAGHTHVLQHTLGDRFSHHIGGAVCGAWWEGPVCPDGSPKGYTVLSLSGEQTSWRYKPVGRSRLTQMAIHVPINAAQGADLVVNVWDWDSRWVLTWFEDGVPRGPLRQARGFDPLSFSLYAGATLPPRQPWIEPTDTSHLFKVSPTTDWRELTVRATDSLGRTFSQTVRRTG